MDREGLGFFFSLFFFLCVCVCVCDYVMLCLGGQIHPCSYFHTASVMPISKEYHKRRGEQTITTIIAP